MEAKSGCPFCALLPERIITRNESAVAIRDDYPLTEGHTLVVPYEHVRSLFDLPATAQHAVWSLITEVRASIANDLGVNAFNVGLNDGEAAGQTIDHAHVHVVPRRLGDVQDPRGGIRWIIPEKAKYWID